MRFSRSPASAGLLCFLVLVGCARGDVPEVSQEPLPELAEEPSGAPVPVVGATTTAVSPTSTSTAVRAGAATTVTTAVAATAPPASVEPRVHARVDDAAGDASGVGASPPQYADARLLVVEAVGQRARVTVQLAGAVPAALAEQEVVGIGVDFFRSGASESDYQLFADGGSDGWRAFLQTPDGFIDYPGDFRLGGDTVQFEVPWSSLGGLPRGTVRLFVDWGKPTIAGLVTRTADSAPDRGQAPLSG